EILLNQAQEMPAQPSEQNSAASPPKVTKSTKQRHPLPGRQRPLTKTRKKRIRKSGNNHPKLHRQTTTHGRKLCTTRKKTHSKGTRMGDSGSRHNSRSFRLTKRTPTVKQHPGKHCPPNTSTNPARENHQEENQRTRKTPRSGRPGVENSAE
ncbi:hypothetical protein Ancab_021750, partial [Ancistrocladus abbreviatus]